MALEAEAVPACITTVVRVDAVCKAEVVSSFAYETAFDTPPSPAERATAPTIIPTGPVIIIAATPAPAITPLVAPAAMH